MRRWAIRFLLPSLLSLPLSTPPLEAEDKQGGPEAGLIEKLSAGEELDLRVAYSISPHVTLMFGAAHLWPGAYLKESTPGGSPNIVYAMWDLRL